jgi:hypothetical protein
MNFEWYYSEDRSTHTKTCANYNFPKPQTRKPVNNRMTHSSTLFQKLIGIYIYIYSLSSNLAEGTVSTSQRPIGELCICK